MRFSIISTQTPSGACGSASSCVLVFEYPNSFHQDSPASLVTLQETHWYPLIAWLQNEYGVEVKVFDSLLGAGQSDNLKERLKAVLEGFDEWQLAGQFFHPEAFPSRLSRHLYTAMERATYSTKSFIIALALLRGRLDAEQAAMAASVEVNSQIEKWGEVEDCVYIFAILVTKGTSDPFTSS